MNRHGVLALSISSFALGACSDSSTRIASTASASAASAAPPPSLSAAPPASASAVATPAPTGSASPRATVTPQEFCARAVALGERNMRGAPLSDRENISAHHYVKPLRLVGTECALRAESTSVEFHGDVAARCLEAAERCGAITFYAFYMLPECRGVVTGKVGEGQPALFSDACAPGLSLVNGRCVKPVPKNGDCDEFPGGFLGDSSEHPRCEAGTECIQLGFGADGIPHDLRCLVAQKIGEPCKFFPDTCTDGAACYQGKCRARAQVGGVCMNQRDCVDGAMCEIKDGVFGQCVVMRTLLDSCAPPKP